MEPFVSKTTANPFKELYKSSAQFNKTTPAIISDYDSLITISIHLTQEAEKFRKQANRYKQLNEHLVEQCDKLKHEYEYIDARYAMAKKWLKNEFELREAAEKDRDVLAQIVQLCKELIEDDPKLFDQMGFLSQIPDRREEMGGDFNDDIRSVGSDRSEKVDELLRKIKRVDSRSKRAFDMNDLRAEIEDMDPQRGDSTFDETGEILNDLLSPDKAQRKRRSANFRRKSGGKRLSGNGCFPSPSGYLNQPGPHHNQSNCVAPKPSGYQSFIEKRIPEENEDDLNSESGNMSILGDKCGEKDPIGDKYLYTKKSRRDSGHGGRRRMSREFRIKNSESGSDKHFDEAMYGADDIVEEKVYENYKNGNIDENLSSAKESDAVNQVYNKNDEITRLGKNSKFQELAKQHESRSIESGTLGSMLPVKGDAKPFKKISRRSIFNPTMIGSPSGKKIKKILGMPFRNEKMNLSAYCPENNNANRPDVPVVLQAAVFELKRRNAIEYNHVYRQVGNKIKVNVLSDTLLVKNLSLTDAKKELSKVRDTATITSFVKKFFSTRLLEPVLTFDGLTFLANLVTKDKAAKDSEVHKSYSAETINKIKLVLNQLSPVYIDTLSMMMLHFQLIEEKGSKNKINVYALAKSVAADFIGYRVSKPSFRDVKLAEGYQSKVFKALMQVESGFYEGYYKEKKEDGVDQSKSSILHKAKKLIFE